jgi:hypothetical protein
VTGPAPKRGSELGHERSGMREGAVVGDESRAGKVAGETAPYVTS